MTTHTVNLSDPVAVADHLYELALDFAAADVALERCIYSNAEESPYEAARATRSAARHALTDFRRAVVEANR